MESSTGGGSGTRTEDAPLTPPGPTGSPGRLLSVLLALAASATFGAVIGRGQTVHDGLERPATSPAPEARAHHQLVRHPSDDRVYLVGGSTRRGDGHHYFDDMWAWDGEVWTLEARLPFPRSSHRVVHHAGRGTLLMFGGTDGDTVRADGTLREWDTDGWAVLARSREAATAEPGACYDRRRDRLVLHGGARPDGGYGSSTWEWDGRRLRRRATGGPGPRLGHVLAWDPATRRCLLFGGRDERGLVHADTWSWHGTGWRRLDVEGPSARWIHTAATDGRRDRIVLFGGQGPDGVLLGDTWAWDGSRWRRITASGPAPRMMGQMAPDGVGVLLFGGRGRAEDGFRDLGDTWRLESGAWRRLDS